MRGGDFFYFGVLVRAGKQAARRHGQPTCMHIGDWMDDHDDDG
jgi:hypothetical protein